MQEYEDEFFGEGSKGVDRMVIGKEENEEVGRRADGLLRRLGRHVPTRAAAKVVEWLVRRFRSVTDIDKALMVSESELISVGVYTGFTR